MTQFDPCTAPYFAERYAKTKEFSPFNDVLYVRNNNDRIVTIGRGNKIIVTPDGEMSATPVHAATSKASSSRKCICPKRSRR